MANNLDVNSPTPATRNTATYGRGASTICLLAGIWFFVSPWVYGAAGSANAWNSWIIGAVMFIVGAVRLGSPVYSAGLSWLNTVLGIWVFFSPWIYGYVGNTGRFINSLCVGVIVFVLSIVSAMSSRRRTMSPITHT
ncbi:MAG TPA: SPW repeat protein [Bryobacteraceae bacterium]|nr:SPW repeat protein [Bryobacteraceae bacterium]